MSDLLAAAREWLEARTAAMDQVTPHNFSRLAQAEGALADVTRDAERCRVENQAAMLDEGRRISAERERIDLELYERMFGT